MRTTQLEHMIFAPQGMFRYPLSLFSKKDDEPSPTSEEPEKVKVPKKRVSKKASLTEEGASEGVKKRKTKKLAEPIIEVAGVKT